MIVACGTPFAISRRYRKCYASIHPAAESPETLVGQVLEPESHGRFRGLPENTFDLVGRV